MVQVLVQASGEFSLKLSVSKIEVMVLARGDYNIEMRIIVNGEQFWQVE